MAILANITPDYVRRSWHVVTLLVHVLRYHEEMAHSHRSGNRDENGLVIVTGQETGMRLVWS